MAIKCKTAEQLSRAYSKLHPDAAPKLKFMHSLGADDIWRRLVNENTAYFAQHGYLPIIFDSHRYCFAVDIRRPGRPHSSNPCVRKISVRLKQSHILKLDSYCQTNNITDYSEAIRSIIEAL